MCVHVYTCACVCTCMYKQGQKKIYVDKDSLGQNPD